MKPVQTDKKLNLIKNQEGGGLWVKQETQKPERSSYLTFKKMLLFLKGRSFTKTKSKKPKEVGYG
jgi:hypothetical protein